MSSKETAVEFRCGQRRKSPKGHCCKQAQATYTPKIRIILEKRMLFGSYYFKNVSSDFHKLGFEVDSTVGF